MESYQHPKFQIFFEQQRQSLELLQMARTEALMSGNKLEAYSLRNKIKRLNDNILEGKVYLSNEQVNSMELNIRDIIVDKNQIDFNIVRFCPAKCRFCSVPSSLFIDEVGTTQYLNESQRIIERLENTNSSINRVIITGGEPLQNINRTCALIKILASGSIDWEVLSIITNGQFLTLPNIRLLEQSGLKQIAWSMHSFDKAKNNSIFGVDIDLDENIKNLQKTNTELRLNMTLQKSGVGNYEQLIEYLDCAGVTKIVSSVYCRKLFEFTKTQQGYESHPGYNRNSREYAREQAVDIELLLQNLRSSSRFELVHTVEFDSRKKTENYFFDKKTGIKLYISELTIGGESPYINTDHKLVLPYLVQQPDGKLYTNYTDGKQINF